MLWGRTARVALAAAAAAAALLVVVAGLGPQAGATGLQAGGLTWQAYPKIVKPVIGYGSSSPNPGTTTTTYLIRDWAQSVSCPSANICAGGTRSGFVLNYNGSSWTESSGALDGTEGIVSVSCSPQGFCAALDAAGLAHVSSDDGTTWSGYLDPSGNNTYLYSVSCPGLDGISGANLPPFCMAVSGAGRAYVYNGTWTATGENAGQPLIAVSCTSWQFCMAIDASGHETTYSRGTWSAPYQYSQAGTPTALSCYTYPQGNLVADGCLVGFNGGRVRVLQQRHLGPESHGRPAWDRRPVVYEPELVPRCDGRRQSGGLGGAPGQMAGPREVRPQLAREFALLCFAAFLRGSR